MTTALDPAVLAFADRIDPRPSPDVAIYPLRSGVFVLLEVAEV